MQQFSLSRQQIMNIVSLYQNRTFANEVEQLSQHGNDLSWLLSSVASDQKDGVSRDQASLQRRQAQFGSNKKKPKDPPSFCKLFINALNEFILIVLLVAALLSIALETSVASDQDRKIVWLEGFFILLAVMICALVTSVNDYKKELQFISLNERAGESKVVTVYRDGEVLSLHQDLVLVGDVVRVDEGMEIPADGILLEAHDVTTDESPMTGEADPMNKNVLEYCAKVWRENVEKEFAEKKTRVVPSPILMSGTRVLTGEGLMMVMVVGDLSCIGKIMALLEQEDESMTPLQQKLEVIARDIGKFGLISAVFILLVLLIRFAVDKGTSKEWNTGEDLIKLLKYLILAITVVVVAIPQGLPLSVTLSLAFSVHKMRDDQNLVRRMEACETMGGADNICSDKTGTLTLNVMVLAQIWNADLNVLDLYEEKLEESSLSKNNEFLELFKISTTVNSTALLEPQEKGSSTQRALLKYCKRLGVSYKEYRDKYPVRTKFPFSSQRKRMSTVVSFQEKECMVVKGASQIILQSCEEWYNHKTGELETLSSGKKAEIEGVINDMASNSLRTLCLAYKMVSPHENYQEKDLSSVYQVEKSRLVLLAVVGVRDIPRKEVPGAIAKCKRAGIKVRMVTGDNLITAQAIAKDIGIMGSSGLDLALEGPKFNEIVGGVVCKKCRVQFCDCPRNQKEADETERQLRVDTIANSEEFDKLMPNLLVLARSRPQDKYCLVTGLRERGCVVAVTGDGTNDAPALHKADVGFAMGISGTEVAREAASITLLDDNFNSIVKAVAWGRNIYDSIRKFIQFQLTVNVVAVVVTLVGSGLYQKQVLKPIQMLWVNLIMDTLASLALATEDPSEELLERKPHSRQDYIVNPTMMKHIIGQSIFQILIILTVMLHGQHFIPEYRDQLDETTFLNSPQNKWHNGAIDGTVRSGRFYHISGADDYETVFDEHKIYSRHFTFIFNTFVMMQVFNFLNSRKLHEEFNIFSGILSHPLFIIIVVGIFGLQILLVSVAGYGFGLYKYGLTIEQWLISIGFGALSLIVSLLLKLLPFGKPPASARVHSNELEQSFTNFDVGKKMTTRISADASLVFNERIGETTLEQIMQP